MEEKCYRENTQLTQPKGRLFCEARLMTLMQAELVTGYREFGKTGNQGWGVENPPCVSSRGELVGYVLEKE